MSGEESDMQELCFCSDPIVNGTEALLDSCSHVFHFECISAWLKKKNNCPMCRATVSVLVDSRTTKAHSIKKSDFSYKDFVEGENPTAEIEQTYEPCYVCNANDPLRDNCLLLCDGVIGDRQCSRTCHYDCGGLSGVPEGEWLCDFCETSRVLPPIQISQHALNLANDFFVNIVPENHQTTVSQNSLPRFKCAVYSPSCLSQLMREQHRLDICLSTEKVSTEHRRKLLPLVVRHMNHWRRLKDFRNIIVENGLLKDFAMWLSPDEILESGSNLSLVRFALLQQLRHIAPLLNFCDVKESKIAKSVAKCFQNSGETAANLEMEQELISVFRKLVPEAKNHKNSEAFRELVCRRQSVFFRATSSLNASYARLELPTGIKTVKTSVVGASAIRGLPVFNRDENPVPKRPSDKVRLSSPPVAKRALNTDLDSRFKRMEFFKTSALKAIKLRIQGDAKTHKPVAFEKLDSLAEAAFDQLFNRYRAAIMPATERRNTFVETDDPFTVLRKTLMLDQGQVERQLDNLIFAVSMD